MLGQKWGKKDPTYVAVSWKNQRLLQLCLKCITWTSIKAKGLIGLQSVYEPYPLNMITQSTEWMFFISTCATYTYRKDSSLSHHCMYNMVAWEQVSYLLTTVCCSMLSDEVRGHSWHASKILSLCKLKGGWLHIKGVKTTSGLCRLEPRPPFSLGRRVWGRDMGLCISTLKEVMVGYRIE